MQNYENWKKAVISGVSALCFTALNTGLAQAQVYDDDEIVVTATKREQTLQEIPLAVTVTDSDTIEKAKIIDIIDLQSVVPSLRVPQFQSSANTNFIVRGFGNGDNNIGIEPSVGVFVDGVYRSRSAAQISDLPQLERVEVLRGPQSTLFGKNASAGVISVVTARPEFETSGYAELNAGNFGLIQGKGYITGPLSDSVAYSLGGSYNKRDGYFTDPARDTKTNERNRFSLRGQLLVQPSDNTDIRIIADYDEIDEICCSAVNVTSSPAVDAIRAIGGQVDVENPFSYEVFYNLDSTNEISNGGVSMQIDHAFDKFTLTSISSYRSSDSLNDQDSDFTSASLIRKNEQHYKLDTYTQELRIASNGEGRIDWLAGAFLFKEEVEGRVHLENGSDSRPFIDILSGGGVTAVEQTILGLPAGTFFRDGSGVIEEMGQDNTAFSLFGQLDFHVSDKLTLTGGLNFTSDEKDAYVRQPLNTNPFAAIDLVSVGNQVLYFGALSQTLAGFGIDVNDPAAVGGFAAAMPDAFNAIVAGSQAFADANQNDPSVNTLLGLQPLQFLPPFVDFPNAVENGNTKDDKVTWIARAAYELNDNINFYLSAATGFKATSWNLTRDSRPFSSDLAALQAAGLIPVNLSLGNRYAGPEEAFVLEAGLKAKFDKFSFNLAVFDQQIKDFQANSFTGSGFTLANAGKQSTKGVEFDARWNPVDPLVLTFAGTFLDPLYDSFPNAFLNETTGQLEDLSGQKPAGIHETSLTTSATYSFDLNDSIEGYVRADYSYDSNVQAAELIPIDRKISLFNASMGLTHDNGWSATLWARNLFDYEYLITVFPGVVQPQSVYGYPNTPRTYGVSLRKQF